MLIAIMYSPATQMILNAGPSIALCRLGNHALSGGIL